MKRCDEVIVQLIVREYNDAGEPVGELTSQPVKVFRATAPDIWAVVDSTMAIESRGGKVVPSP